MKIYVGIDIAKLNHFAAAISSDGEIILEPFKFTNDADGFQLLVSKLESFDKSSIIIGPKSTARYGDNLVRYLVAEFYQVRTLNPIKTCQMHKNNVRKTKADKVDTFIIAKTLMMQDDFRFITFFNLDMMDLKALGRFQQKTIKQRTRLKIQLTTYVDNIMKRQCLSRRIATIDKLKCELSAWEMELNQDTAKIQWHFQTRDAREKLISLYPVLQSTTS